MVQGSFYFILGGVSSSYLFCLESKKTVVTENSFCSSEGYSMNANKLCTEDRAVCEVNFTLDLVPYITTTNMLYFNIQGDQGAPLVINDRIFGIATAAFKAVNCQGAIVTPYTRVTSYLRWINQITTTGTPCLTC